MYTAKYLRATTNWVAKIKGFQNQSLWQRLNSFGQHLLQYISQYQFIITIVKLISSYVILHM